MGYIFQKREAAEDAARLIMFLDRKHKLHKEPVFKGLPKHCKAFSVAERNTRLIIERSQWPLGFYFVTRSLKWIQTWGKEWSLVPCQASGTLLAENTGKFTTWGLKNTPWQKNIIILLSTRRNHGRETHSFCILNRLEVNPRNIWGQTTQAERRHKEESQKKKNNLKIHPACIRSLYWSAVHLHHVCESVCTLKLACPLLNTHTRFL